MGNYKRTYYRLPTATEVQNYPVREHPQIGCWNIGESDDRNKGIRVVKTQIPSLFEFDVVTINAQGQEIERERRHSQYFTEDFGNDITLDMVAIPMGKFQMGTEDKEIARLVNKYNQDYFRIEQPQHEVIVTPFFMGKYPITHKMAVKLIIDLLHKSKI